MAEYKRELQHVQGDYPTLCQLNFLSLELVSVHSSRRPVAIGVQYQLKCNTGQPQRLHLFEDSAMPMRHCLEVELLHSSTNAHIHTNVDKKIRLAFLVMQTRSVQHNS